VCVKCDANTAYISMSVVESYYVYVILKLAMYNYVGCGLILYVYVILVFAMYNYVRCDLIIISMPF
jgi:hypothetical protein